MWLESEMGKGSTFHFTARFGTVHHPAAQHTLLDGSVLENKRVLIVDDNATNREILEKTLAYWRMRPTAVSNATAALKVLREAHAVGSPFHLLVADCHMPDVDGFTLVEQIQKSPDFANLVTIMLTSGGQPGDGLRCKELGISAYLIKPALQADMLEALLQVLSTRSGADKPVKVVTRHTLREDRAPLKILLAEDNAVNQKLASRLLENQGHSVVVAIDGAQALAFLEKQNFDLILMDAQMPIMDGFEATAAIRHLEEATRAHIPIVAMTAHAMVGDRQRCLDAGMDGYIAKPIHARELFETIETVLAAAPLQG